MGYHELRSAREAARQNAGKDDVFQYDDFPPELRTQIVFILHDAIGEWNQQYGGEANDSWRMIFDTYVREKGVFALTDSRHNPYVQCCDYILSADTINLLDFVEMAFRYIDVFKLFYGQHGEVTRVKKYAEAIEDLNLRLRKAGLGYEFTGGELIRIDSKLIHAEAVRPALQLLHGAGAAFKGPLDEFMSSHHKYRDGDHKGAIVEACKAFESTLKSICTERQWAFDSRKDTAQKLIDIVFSNGLIPSYMQQEFTSLRAVLESGVPTARNKTSGHGQGPDPTRLPEHFVAYVLHLTASNIVYLIECHKTLV